MELQEIYRSVSHALTAVNEMQRLTAMNVANANIQNAKSVSFDIANTLSAVFELKSVSTDMIKNEVSRLSSMSIDSVKLDQQVLISSQLKGKYNAIVESFNKQAALYQIAIGKGR
jgi:flagellar basal body rod protein FlgB